jgi:hypothetical protein
MRSTRRRSTTSLAFSQGGDSGIEFYRGKRIGEAKFDVILRLTFSVIFLTSVLARTAVASEASAPIEQLDAGLLQVMKLGKSAPSRQRYDLLAPLVVRAIDLDLILQNGVGSGWTSITCSAWRLANPLSGFVIQNTWPWKCRLEVWNPVQLSVALDVFDERRLGWRDLGGGRWQG